MKIKEIVVLTDDFINLRKTEDDSAWALIFTARSKPDQQVIIVCGLSQLKILKKRIDMAIEEIGDLEEGA